MFQILVDLELLFCLIWFWSLRSNASKCHSGNIRGTSWLGLVGNGASHFQSILGSNVSRKEVYLKSDILEAKGFLGLLFVFFYMKNEPWARTYLCFCICENVFVPEWLPGVSWQQEWLWAVTRRHCVSSPATGPPWGAMWWENMGALQKWESAAAHW